MQIEKTGLTKTAVGALKRNKLNTTEDLAAFFPRAYYDYRRALPIEEAPAGRHAAVRGKLLKCESKMGKRSFLQFTVVSAQGQKPFNVFLFSNVFRFSTYRTYIGSEIVLMGKVTSDPYFGKSIQPDEIVLLRDFRPHIQPVYRKIKGISAEKLSSLIVESADMQPELLEPSVRAAFNLPSYRETLRKLHRPMTGVEIKEGQDAARFYDLIYFSLRFFGGKKASDKGIRFADWSAADRMIASLPFPLTKDQESFITRFRRNAEVGKRNDVLLQGDVGSGKTAVALACMAGAAGSGCQSVLMAPREALAAQHYEKAAGILGHERTVFLRSGMKATERRKALEDIRTGKALYIIGTHSCIGEGVDYKKLGLIVTDEEHLFGVQQKDALALKAENGVHRISLSATPIPRSLATVLYGDTKEIAAIHTMPAGRLPIKTCAVTDRRPVFSFIRKQAAAGHGTYVICPAIDAEEETGLTNVLEAADAYRKALPDSAVGVVHGRMKAAEAQTMIDAFAKGQLDVLISTTVIEVGIDVPRATLIVIEQADRFGLASLHQLRGRVGRNSLQSFCILLTEHPDAPRIRAVCETTDGFRIAEADMALRGSGNLIGTEQAGMNRYVEEMLADPKGFALARKTAEYCRNNHCGLHLVEMYDRRDGHADNA